MPIMFKKDWGEIVAVPHIETRNRSFVKVARIFQAMGVENHMFMLALVDESLRDVDPHDPSISAETAMRVAGECFINPWYFFREVCRAPGNSGAAPRQFLANRGNMALYWCFLNNVMALIIQARQTGKSFSTDCMLVWLMQVRCRNTTINILTKDEKLRKSNVDRIKKIMGVLPSYIDQRDKTDANNTETITVKAYSNIIYTHLPSKDKGAADRSARGMTSAIAVIDEPPYQPNIHIALDVALSSGGDACEQAERVGDPWGTIFTTTAGKKDTIEGKFFYDFMMNMTEWNEKFFDAKDKVNLYSLIKTASRSPRPSVRVAIVFNHRQLGYNDEWLKGRLERSTASGESADRDYFNRWTSGSNEHPLDVKTLERIVSSQVEPNYVEITELGGYMVRWYIERDQIAKEMMTGHKLAVFDTSEAGGGDAISMRITDVYTGKLCAALTVNETNIITFAEWIGSIMVKYVNMTVLIERRSTGSSVLDMLLRFLPSINIDPYKRLFNRVVNEPVDNPVLYEESKWPLWRRKDESYYVRIKDKFGFATSGGGVTSRSKLYGEVLNSAAKMVGHLVGDAITISQIASLVRKNNRINHPSGSHDDMVISWVLTHWFCMKAENISVYGIEAPLVLQNVRTVRQETPQEKLHREVQRNVRERIEELTRKMRDTSDSIIIARYEHELRILYVSLDDDQSEKFSVDELIRSIRESKIKNRVFNNNGSGPINRNVSPFHAKNAFGTGMGGYASAHARFHMNNMGRNSGSFR